MKWWHWWLRLIADAKLKIGFCYGEGGGALYLTLIVLVALWPIRSGEVLVPILEQMSNTNLRND